MLCRYKVIRDGQEVATLAGAVQVSDGYHAFDELYEHRIELFLALCREWDEDRGGKSAFSGCAWRSMVNTDGSSCDGYFIMGIGHAPGLQITYHLPLSRWEDASFAATLKRAPRWDGHTPADVLERLKKL